MHKHVGLVIFSFSFPLQQVISIEVNNGKEGPGPIQQLMKAKGYSQKAKVSVLIKPGLQSNMSTLISTDLAGSTYLIYQLNM
jgi:hypothetical protein